MRDKEGTLFLLPNLLDASAEKKWSFPPGLDDLIPSLQGIIAESEKEARRYLKSFSFPERASFRQVPICLLNEHTKEEEVKQLLEPLLQGQTWGLISDAGLPCIADPGARLVRLCRKRGVQVEAICGPSSIFLSLMLSGLGAQRFCFQGYLEREPALLRQEIKRLEKESSQKSMTQVFIEAPYRCQSVFLALMEVLEPTTELSLCVDLMTLQQRVETGSIQEWRKKELIDLHKKQVVFVFAAQSRSLGPL
jgi:16S rRNA (cytidine1402-2'-O)-methyltransferase